MWECSRGLQTEIGIPKKLFQKSILQFKPNMYYKSEKHGIANIISQNKSKY